jgi:AraC-like DNA-binding protein
MAEHAPAPPPAVAHLPAIERTIALMRAHMHEPLAIDDLAAAAYLSPFHFSRVFRRATGVPPGEFLTALRLDAAKRLLLTTPLSVTEICYEVGYASLGTFTTRFTALVGLPPTALRRLASDPSPERVATLRSPAPTIATGGLVAVHLIGPPGWHGTICCGLFPRPLPAGAPAACALASKIGRCLLGPAPPGRYALLAAAMPRRDDPRAYLLPDSELLVGAAWPVSVSAGLAADMVLHLRPPRATDPPVVVALPLLLARFAP